MIIFLNKKSAYLIVFIVIVLSGIITLITYNTTKTTINMPVTNKVIVLDAGHGGMDPGASNSNSLEKDINLKITLKVRSLLEESGALVLLTREKDESLYIDDKNKSTRQKYNENLKNRKKLIKESKADVFVSIHLNSFPQKKYYGAQTLYIKNDEESKKLAKFIQDELRRILDKNNYREIKGRDDLYLLKDINIPSVLIECGFLSNDNEKELLKSDKYQEKIAWAIYIGIQKYFSVVD